MRLCNSRARQRALREGNVCSSCCKTVLSSRLSRNLLEGSWVVVSRVTSTLNKL